MLEGWLGLNHNATVLLSVAIIWLAGFLVTRLTKLLKLPNVTGYILGGILIGPYVLNIIPVSIVDGMDFITDAALAFIAFGVGRYLRIETIKKCGIGIIVLTVFESLMAAAAVFIAMYFVFHLSLDFSLLLSAIASATAPASSLMTIRQYRAKGIFVDTLVQVVALDDAVALIAFGVCSAIAQASESNGALNVAIVVAPLLYNFAAILVGAVLGWLLGLLTGKNRSKEHRLVLGCAFIFILAAMCTAVNVSPLLSVMVMGTVYINLHKDKALFKQINKATPPILTIFFVLSGMRLNLDALATAGMIGVVYFFVRIIGKCVGAYTGALVAHSARTVRNYLGMALIPQAGVSIGLAVLSKRMLPAASGEMLSTIILSSSVLYEMIGPASAKAALMLSGAIPNSHGHAAAKLLRHCEPQDNEIVTEILDDMNEADDIELTADKRSKSDIQKCSSEPDKSLHSLNSHI